MDFPIMTHSHDVTHWLQTPREYLESEADVSVVLVAAASGVERRSRALKMFLEKWSLSTSAFSLSSSSYSSSTSRASLSELASQELSQFAVDSCDICRLFVTLRFWVSLVSSWFGRRGAAQVKLPPSSSCLLLGLPLLHFAERV